MDLLPEEREYLSSILEKILIKHNCYPNKILVLEDHVRILFDININTSIQKIVNVIKGYSSFLMRKRFERLRQYSTFWIKGFYIMTFGEESEKKIQSRLRKLQK